MNHISKLTTGTFQEVETTVHEIISQYDNNYTFYMKGDFSTYADARTYAARYADHRYLSTLIDVIELRAEQAKQKVRTTVLTESAKAPAATLIESMAENDPAVVAWDVLRLKLVVVRDQYAGLVKGLEIFSGVSKFA